MGESEQECFWVGSWRIEPLLHRVSRGETVRMLEPRLMDLLEFLARNAGKTLVRDRILDEVWSDAVVTDHTLTRSVSEIRKALDDDPGEPHVIETIRKTGYRLIAAVSYAGPAGGESATGQLGSADRSSPGDRPEPAAKSPFLRSAVSTVLAVVIVAAVVLGGHEAFTDTTSTRETDATVIHGLPAWSPDGRRAAFVRRIGDRDVVVVRSVLQPAERVTVECRAAVGSLSWSPDGRHLTFALNPEAPEDIFILDVASQALGSLTRPSIWHMPSEAPPCSLQGRPPSF